MAKIDLHIHSHYSDDGEFSIPEIMQLCKQSKVEYMAITDHNTVRGVSEALTLSAQMGMKVISGVELDCIQEGKNFHLLGYHFNHTLPVFDEIEQNILTQERDAAQEKIELIRRETGVPLSVEEVMKKAEDGVVTGELIGEILTKREDAGNYKVLLPYLPGGSRADNPYVNFYWDYFAQGKPAYVPIKYMSMKEGINLFHEAGGIAVLAHPGQNLKGDNELLEGIIKEGIDGIEAYSSYHGKIAAALFELVAAEKKLLVTCGSDFHGKIKPEIPICGHGAERHMLIIERELRAKLLERS